MLGIQAGGVYAGVLSSKVQATPTVTDAGSHTFTATSASATAILYTTDGSDPRYSPTAATYPGSAVTVPAGTVVNAVAFRTGYFTSAVATQTIA